MIRNALSRFSIGFIIRNIPSLHRLNPLIIIFRRVLLLFSALSVARCLARVFLLYFFLNNIFLIYNTHIFLRPSFHSGLLFHRTVFFLLFARRFFARSFLLRIDHFQYVARVRRRFGAFLSRSFRFNISSRSRSLFDSFLAFLRPFLWPSIARATASVQFYSFRRSVGSLDLFSRSARTHTRVSRRFLLLPSRRIKVARIVLFRVL